MVRLNRILLFVIIFSLIFSSDCFAFDQEKLIDDFLNSDQQGIEYENVSENFQFNKIFTFIINLLSDQLSNTTKLLSSVFLIIILVSILENFDFNSRKELKNIVSAVVCTVIITICYSTLESNIDIIKNTIDKTKIFATSAIPIVTTLCIAAGESITASVFSVSVSFICGIFQFVSESVLIPLIVCFLLLGVAGCITTDFNIFSLTELIKKGIKGIIKLFITIFTFSISVQNVLSKSADNFTKKSIQTAVTKFIPVIGSNLSGGVEGMFALATASKTSLGILGVLIIIVLFLPIIIGNCCYGYAMLICKYTASFLKVEKIDKISGVISDVFFILAAVSTACAFMVIISFLLICFNL